MEPTLHRSPRPSIVPPPRSDRKAVVEKASASRVPADAATSGVDAVPKLVARSVRAVEHTPRHHPLSKRLTTMASRLEDESPHPLSLDKVPRTKSNDLTGFLTPWYGAAAALGRACADVSAGQPSLTPEAVRKAFPLPQRSSLLAALYVSQMEAPRWMAGPAAEAVLPPAAKESMSLDAQRWMFHLARAFGPEEFMPAAQQERARALADVVAKWGESLDWEALSDEERGAQLQALAVGLARRDKLDVGRMRWKLVNRPGGPLVSRNAPGGSLKLNTGWSRLGDAGACLAELLQAHQAQYQITLMNNLMSGALGPKAPEYEMARVFVATGALGALRPDEVAELNGITFGEAQEWLQALPSAVHALASTRAVLSTLSAAASTPGSAPDTAPQPASGSSGSVPE